MPQQTSEKINLDQTPLIIKQNRKNTNLGKRKNENWAAKIQELKRGKGNRKTKGKTKNKLNKKQPHRNIDTAKNQAEKGGGNLKTNKLIQK